MTDFDYFKNNYIKFLKDERHSRAKGKIAKNY